MQQGNSSTTKLISPNQQSGLDDHPSHPTALVPHQADGDLLWAVESAQISSAPSPHAYHFLTPSAWPVFQQPIQPQTSRTFQLLAPKKNEVEEDNNVVTKTIAQAPENWSSLTRFATTNRSSNSNSNHRIKSKFNASEIEYVPAHEMNSTNRITGHKFPSIIDPALTTNEDEFNKQLSLADRPGSYQRTNATNMSWAQLLRQATESNIMESLMVTNKTTVSLLCDTDDMLVRLKFKQPFKGVIATDLDRLKSCRLVGNGNQFYKMRIPLLGCGTRQEMPHLFINNINIQFSQSFDVVEDEVKTIICSYPIRPRAPPPADLARGNGAGNQNLLDRIVEPPSSSEPAKLIYYEPLILISSLLLLVVALLGLTGAAHLLARRRDKRRSSASQWSNSNSFASSRLYRSPPAQAANLSAITALEPPLIDANFPSNRRIGGANRRLEAKTRAKYTQDGYRKRSGSYGGASVLRPVAQGKYKTAVTSAEVFRSKLPETVSVIPVGPDKTKDSLGSEESSVTTIDIPLASEGTERIVQSSGTNTHSPKIRVQDPKKSDENRHQTPNTQVPASAVDSQRQNLPKTSQSFPKTPPLPATLASSFRKTLTSPQEYRRLQNIARLFAERISPETGSVERDRRNLLRPSRYRDKILEMMSDEERKKVGKLLFEDELFRSRVVESMDKSTFDRKLRNSPFYSLKLSPKSWDLLEEILLDKDANFALKEQHSESHRAETWNNVAPAIDAPGKTSANSDTRQRITVSASTKPVAVEKAQVPKSDDGRRPTTTQGSTREMLGKSEKANVEPPIGVGSRRQAFGNSSSISNGDDDNNCNEDSLEQSSSEDPDSLKVRSSSRLVEYKESQRHELVEGDDSDENSEPFVRVSQFNSTRTLHEGGLTGTLINIDSVTEFKSTRNFSTFTRSSIEHTEYKKEEFLDDKKVAKYEYATEKNLQRKFE